MDDEATSNDESLRGYSRIQFLCDGVVLSDTVEKNLVSRTQEENQRQIGIHRALWEIKEALASLAWQSARVTKEQKLRPDWTVSVRVHVVQSYLT